MAIRSEINVTPLVDVCLVLLIIFMVVTPMIGGGVQVALPATVSPDKIPETARQLTLAVSADGSMFVAEAWVSADALAPTLAELHRASPDRSVVIKADRALKYGQVRRVMQVVNEAGFAGVSLVTTRLEQTG
jgi:biopolymer transport protein ExbD